MERLLATKVVQRQLPRIADEAADFQPPLMSVDDRRARIAVNPVVIFDRRQFGARAGDGCHERAGVRQRMAVGPTRAFAVVKELTRSYTAGGVAGADALLADAAVGLFDTDDARGGIRSFLTSGPGHATFAGR